MVRHRIVTLVVVATLGTLVPSGVAGPIEADLLAQGFEGAAVPPIGWTVTDTNPTNNWQVIDGTIAPAAVHGGQYAAFVNFDPTLQQDEWLRSPVLALPSSAQAITLEFWLLTDTNFCITEGATTTVVVTDMADVELGVAWDMCASQVWTTFQYRLVTVDLTAWAGQVVKLAWRYVGSNGQSVGLDDIRVTETSPPPFNFSDGFESGGFSAWSEVFP